MRELEKIAENLFEKIRGRFEEISVGDENANSTLDPQKARLFNFDFTVGNQNYGNVTLSIIDGASLKVYFSKNISQELQGRDQQEWYEFLKDSFQIHLLKSV